MIDLKSERVWVFLNPTDMRKSFDTLAALVQSSGHTPTNGDVYVFTNKRRNRFKLLVFTSGGYWLLCKRLEEGVLAVPLVEGKSENHYVLEIDLTQLRLLIEGYEIKNIKKNSRFVA
jgi:transposase